MGDVARLQPHPDHPVEDERQKADQRVCPNPMGQTVEERSDLDLGLEHPKAAFDVDQRLVVLRDLLRAQIGYVAYKHEVAVGTLEPIEHALIEC
jgi:hypothetical protein